MKETIRKRCSDLEAIENTTDSNDVGELLDKFQNILIETKQEKTQIEKLNENKQEIGQPDQTLDKSKFEENVVTSKNCTKYTEKVNYFSKTSTQKDKQINDKYKLAKEKILKNKEKNTKYGKAKSMSLNECFILLKEHEKRVQVRILSCALLSEFSSSN